MHRTELDYELPADLIAQAPADPRDSARLMLVERAAARIAHLSFPDIAELLHPGDCLVLNDTRVIPARFFARRATGGRVEGLFIRETVEGWLALLSPAARLRPAEVLQPLAADGQPWPGPTLVLVERRTRGEWLVRPEPAVAPLALLGQIGRTPLPPYIAHAADPAPADAQRYQTVYARTPGAIAAPTAGLHFTPRVLDALRQRGVGRAEVTLHVGVGTFAPIDAEALAQHEMHAEWFEATADACRRVRAARAAGGRIVAVGTTAARVLETLAADAAAAPDTARTGWTDIFIFPPYRFRSVDVLLTNFHLPGSTLLALVMALAGVELTRRAYAEAIAERYRFYSYGDAMLIV